MTFRHDQSADSKGTSFAGRYRASYAELSAKFGPGDVETYDNRVTTQWKFVSDAGDPITLYEYKETAEYGEPDAPTLVEFRALPEHDWHVGTKGPKSVEGFRHFAYWLKLELMMGKKVRVAPYLDPRDYTAEGQQLRRPGAVGEVIGHSDGHGLCWKVRHEDGSTAHYDPDELTDEAAPKPPTRYDRIGGEDIL